jgi:transposase
VKSMDAHTLRMLLVARSRLVSQRQATANTIRGLLKTFGLVVARGSKGLFPVRVREQIAGNPALVAIIEPLLAVWHAIRDQMAILDRQMLARARNDQVTRQLITIPGVGVVIALAYTYTAVIDDPARFRRSVSVGAYLGLTPGVTSPVRSTPLGTSRNAGTACYADISTKPPPCSYRDSRASVLKSWGLGLAKRIGMRRAKSRSRASSRSSCIGFGAIRANTAGRRYHRLPPEGHPQRQ